MNEVFVEFAKKDFTTVILIQLAMYFDTFILNMELNGISLMQPCEKLSKDVTAKAYFGPWQTSIMELFAKIV